MATTQNPSVRIRMYRQGLGDCFLLSFTQTGKDPFNMLVDCGLLQGTKNDKEIMTLVVEDIESLLSDKTIDGQTKKWLDAVVLTHEHADHISGFSKAKNVFDRIHFGEIWAAWVDDESHPKYKLVRERFHKQLSGLHAALAKMGADDPRGFKVAVKQVIEDFFEDGLLGASGTGGHSPSWDYALQKSIADPRFLTPGTLFTLPGFDGIRIYILGPSEDFESFTQVNPPQDETYRREGTDFALMDSFFAAVGQEDGALSAESFQPFEQRLRVSKTTAATDGFFQTHYGFAPKKDDEWRRIDHDWLAVAGGLALKLDSYTNNTCLAFAIEFVNSRKVLLFPGDAQFSNWLSWQKLSWRVHDATGSRVKVTAKDLLERTVLYKVGHHGSHNATLKKHGLEMMNSPDLMAMIPVNRDKAKSQVSKTNPKGWEMPEKNLFDRLLQRTRGRVVLADEPSNAELTKRCKDQKFIKNVRFLGSFVRDSSVSANQEPLCIELTIKG